MPQNPHGFHTPIDSSYLSIPYAGSYRSASSNQPDSTHLKPISSNTVTSGLVIMQAGNYLIPYTTIKGVIKSNNDKFNYSALLDKSGTYDINLCKTTQQ